MVKVYLAHAMSGRSGSDLVAESRAARAVLEAQGIRVLDPVVAEGVTADLQAVQAGEKQLVHFWKRDKEMIREAHVLLDLTGPAKSEGVAHEIGYARYNLWKPVLRLYPNGLGPSVAWLEDDEVVKSVKEAGWIINQRWGTPAKRIQWRLGMLKRCLGRWILNQLKEFK